MTATRYSGSSGRDAGRVGRGREVVRARQPKGVPDRRRSSSMRQADGDRARGARRRGRYPTQPRPGGPRLLSASSNATRATTRSSRWSACASRSNLSVRRPRPRTRGRAHHGERAASARPARLRSRRGRTPRRRAASRLRRAAAGRRRARLALTHRLTPYRSKPELPRRTKSLRRLAAETRTLRASGTRGKRTFLLRRRGRAHASGSAGR